MIGIETDRFKPTPTREHQFSRDQVDEFKSAILEVGGQLIEERGSANHDQERSEYYRVIDTAARLSALLFGNMYLDLEALRQIFHDDESGFHPIDIIKGASSRRDMSNFLNSVMHVAPIFLINEETPLTPNGLIALSTLSKLPSKQLVRV